MFKNRKSLLLIALLLLFIGSGIFLPYSNEKESDSAINTETKELICLSKSAFKYHTFECRGLNRCTHSIKSVSKAEAIKRGYSPCKICY